MCRFKFSVRDIFATLKSRVVYDFHLIQDAVFIGVSKYVFVFWINHRWFHEWFMIEERDKNLWSSTNNYFICLNILYESFVLQLEILRKKFQYFNHKNWLRYVVLVSNLQIYQIWQIRIVSQKKHVKIYIGVTNIIVIRILSVV